MALVPCIYSAWLSCIVSWSTVLHAGSIEQSCQRHARSCQTSQLKPSTEGLCIVSSQDWIGLCSVLRPHQHSIGYMGDGFYRSKDPTNSIKVLKEKAVKENNPQNTKKTQITHMHAHTK